MKMQRIITTVIPLLFIIVRSAEAVRKNPPDEKEVEEILIELGDDHWVKDMDVDEFASSRIEDPVTEEDTYLHIYTSYVDASEKYRIILFDNEQRYLGYYRSRFEPVDYEENAVLVDAEDGSTYFRLPLSTEGFPSRVRTGLSITTFIENEHIEPDPGPETHDEQQPVQESDPDEPQYRDWTVNIRDREITFNAVFVRRDGDKIVLKESKQGKVNGIPGQLFSEKDQEYLKDILEL
ncbi:hypothetical protein [Pontiella agarivorans]|uniref:Uncharacterized protein n=1 Tax=Pontiella agarivorans TaxID=3038953 RepID=A0ABU5MU36_9BACT|nr:hypothetical protein [Pontiella agarivorans]MDZ8117662.1 hypothetical protein [Pontiella agarivorans]